MVHVHITQNPLYSNTKSANSIQVCMYSSACVIMYGKQKHPVGLRKCEVNIKQHCKQVHMSDQKLDICTIVYNIFTSMIGYVTWLPFQYHIIIKVAK